MLQPIHLNFKKKNMNPQNIRPGGYNDRSSRSQNILMRTRVWVCVCLTRVHTSHHLSI